MIRHPLPISFLEGDSWYAEEVGSTQDEVFALGESGAPEGTLVMAGLQTAGRGRLGRSWTGLPGENLTFSFLTIRPFPFPPSLLWGLAVARTLECLGLRPQIKWPNDVLVDNKKICGILVQAKKGLTVTGIGLNVNQRVFPPDLRRQPTSLVLQGIHRVPVDLLGLLKEQLEVVLSEPHPRDEILSRLWGHGELLTIDLPDGTRVSGIFKDLGSGGEAVLETDQGEVYVHSGEWSEPGRQSALT